MQRLIIRTRWYLKLTPSPEEGGGRILHETASPWPHTQKDHDGGGGEDVRFRMGDGKT